MVNFLSSRIILAGLKEHRQKRFEVTGILLFGRQINPSSVRSEFHLSRVYCIYTLRFWEVFWLNLTNGHRPKYSESCVLSGLYVSLCLKNVTFLHSFSKQKYVGQAGSDLQFVLAVITKYDSRLTFLFLVVVVVGGRGGRGGNTCKLKQTWRVFTTALFNWGWSFVTTRR